jgi:hypothetical protein
VTGYDDTARVPYSDDLRSGYVVGSDRPTPTGDESWSWWYGPGRSWGTTFGGSLDHSVAVFDSKVKAQTAIRKGYGGSTASARRLRIQTLEQARTLHADSLERYALRTLARVAVLRGETS